MQIVMIPEAGTAPTLLQIEGQEMVLNGTCYDLDHLPGYGPVRLEEGVVYLSYARDGALATRQIGEAHDLRIIPVPEDQKCRPDPVPEGGAPGPDTEALALAEARQAMECARWQMIVALGPEGWQSLQDFCAGSQGTWAMQQAVAGFDRVTRCSELADLLAYAVDLDAAAMDDLFRRAMALKL